MDTELPELHHHWVTPEEADWRARFLAEHPEVTGEQADAAIDAVHRLELVGAA